jgi:hypothetical protein
MTVDLSAIADAGLAVIAVGGAVFTIYVAEKLSKWLTKTL